MQKPEDEIQGRGELMHSIYENAIDAIVILDDAGRILLWNPRAGFLFEWLEEEVKDKYFHTIVIPLSNQADYLELIRRIENTGSTATNLIETTAVSRGGRLMCITLGISSSIVNERKYFVLHIKDETERKIATQKLDEQKKFYESILNGLPSDIAVFDPDHKYLFVNPYAIKEEEYRKFIIGKDDFEYCAYRNRDIALAELRRARFLEVIKTGKEIRWEDTVTDANGNAFTSLRRIFPVFNDRNELSMVIGFGLDISDRKIMEEKQTELVKQLSVQNTQLVDFCNIVSHNLRAPLVNMAMLVEYIQESEDETEKNFLIAKLNPVVENLHNTFNELVESLQIKHDLEIQSEKIVLSDCLQRVLDELQIEISKSEVTVRMCFDEAPVVHYPYKYLFSIFQNLVSNALKYQSPDRKPEINIETKKIGNTILLSIQDNGLGIDLDRHKDQMFKIGKVFHRHPNAKGFGLFMTKTQVEAMQGRIWVESTIDMGSTFFIEFYSRH